MPAAATDPHANARVHLALLEDDIAMRKLHIAFVEDSAKPHFQGTIDGLEQRRKDLLATIGTPAEKQKPINQPADKKE